MKKSGRSTNQLINELNIRIEKQIYLKQVQEDSILGFIAEKNYTCEKQLQPEISSIHYTRTIWTKGRSATFA